MLTINENILNELNAPARRISARVELYNCSTLQNDGYNREWLNTFCGDGALIEFKVERVADDGKFFGFGICQKLSVKLRDANREINIHKGQVLEVSFGVNGDFTYPCPLFQIEEVTRDENNNNLTITAYDFLYKANEHRVEELNLTSYNIRTFIQACAALLNLPVKIEPTDGVFNTTYAEGANFKGDETIREALNAVAEATQTIFFVDWDWRLTFRRLNKNATPVLNIDRSKYFELKNKSDRTLTAICHATELGDNVEAGTKDGVVQYVRNNPFWDLHDDIDTLLTNALAIVNGMTISQFDCSWRGNFALEIGDKITMETKSGETLAGYVINDTITYNGGLREQTEWTFTEHNAETASSPVNLGDALKQTYAKVDKANKTIELVVSDMNEFQDGITETVSALTLTTEGITSEVSRIETKFDGSVSSLGSQIKQTADSVNSAVTKVNTVEGKVNTLTSTVNQTAESVSSAVSKVSTLEGKVNTMDSTVKQTAESVSSVVNKVETLQGQVSNMNTTVTQTANSLNSVVSRVSTVEGKTSTMESQIEQNADNIALKVSKDSVISAINLSKESIDISADKLNLTGYAKFSDLSTSGATTINGSNITTGTISGDRINLTGSISFEDLDSSAQSKINSADSNATLALLYALDNNVPDYITSTYIDSVEIKSPKITGNNIKVLNTFQTVGKNGSSEVVTGYMGAAKGMDAAGNTTFGVALSNEWSGNSYAVGSQYLIVTNAGLRLQSDDNRITITPQGAYITVDNGGIFFNHQRLADFVVEEDVDTAAGGWTYRKWNSGFAECWTRRAVNATIDDTWGSLFTSGPISSTNISYPITFVTVPNVQVTPWNNGSAIWVMAAGTWSPPSTTYTGTFEIVRAVKDTAQGSYGLNYYVSGMWK